MEVFLLRCNGCAIVTRMETNATEPYLAVRWPSVERLGEKSGLSSDREWAEKVGVSSVTWWRLRNGHTKPSAGLLARLKFAFPEARLDELFEAVE